MASDESVGGGAGKWPDRRARGIGGDEAAGCRKPLAFLHWSLVWATHKG